MNYRILLLAAIVSASFITLVVMAQSTNAPAVKRAPAFSCDRMALSAEDRKRHFGEVSPALRAAILAVRELPDGFEFELPPGAGTARLLAEWVIRERLCCPFFEIGTRWDREGGSAWLRLTGRPGVKQFIKADLGGWFIER